MQQTFIHHIDEVQPVLDEEDKKKGIDNDDFVPMNFDIEIEEFIEALVDEYMLPVGKQLFPIGDKIICVIDYRKMTPQEKEAYIKHKTGLETNLKNILDADFKV